MDSKIQTSGVTKRNPNNMTQLSQQYSSPPGILQSNCMVGFKQAYNEDSSLSKTRENMTAIAGTVKARNNMGGGMGRALGSPLRFYDAHHLPDVLASSAHHIEIPNPFTTTLAAGSVPQDAMHFGRKAWDHLMGARTFPPHQSDLATATDLHMKNRMRLHQLKNLKNKIRSQQIVNKIWPERLHPSDNILVHPDERIRLQQPDENGFLVLKNGEKIRYWGPDERGMEFFSNRENFPRSMSKMTRLTPVTKEGFRRCC